MQRRTILAEKLNFFIKRSLCGSLALNSGIFFFAASIWLLLPSYPVMGQSRTFQGVQVPQEFDANSDLADLIELSTEEPSRNSQVRLLGQWVVVPGSRDNYYTYRMQEITVQTTFRVYTIFLILDATSNNPKYLRFGVDCDENKLRPVSYRVFSSRGNTLDRQLVDEPWAAPTNNFWQSLVSGVCGLGS